MKRLLSCALVAAFALAAVAFAQADEGEGGALKPKPGAVYAKEYAASRAWLKDPVLPPEPARPNNQKRIRLIADRGAMGDGVYILGAGMPFREGQVRDLNELAIESPTQGPLPAVFEKRTLWPDGSIQWVWADFQARVEPEYYLTIGQRKGALPERGMQVTEADGAVLVNNGLVEMRWDKRFATPVSVAVLNNIVGRVEVATGDGKGVYFIDQNDRRAVLGGDGSELQFTVESSNPLRTVLRIEGWYVSTAPVARAVVRYYINWNQPDIRMDHTFIVTKENDELWYKEIGITLPIKREASVRAYFGIDGAEAAQVSVGGATREASIYQDQYPVYYKKDLRCAVMSDASQVSQASVAAGWAEMTSGAAGLIVAVRDFAPQFPKELTATTEGLTAKLWSGRDGRVLDYKASTIAKDWWGKWLNRLDRSRDQIAAKKRMEKSGAKTDWAYFTEDQIRQIKASSVGVARTHNLAFSYYSGAREAARAATLNAQLHRAAAVLPDPRWLMHVDRRIISPMVARGEGGAQHEIIERGISAWLEEAKTRQEIFPYTGWYEWGKHPNLAAEKAEDGAVYMQWYRLTSTNPYYYNLNMMLTWMRTGERKYLDETENVNRWLADNEHIHWGGGKEQRIRGARFGGHTRAPIYWIGKGNFSSPSTEDITSFAYEYFLRDNRRLREIFDMATEAFVASFDVKSKMATPDIAVMRMAGLYRVKQDPRLLALMKEYVRAWTDPSTPDGGSPTYWRGSGTDSMMYKIHRKTAMLLYYHDLTGDDYVVPIIVKAAIRTLEHYGPKYTQPFYYQHRFGMIGARVYQWTKDPDMLFWARHQVEGASEVFQRYFELPPNQRGLERARTSRTTPQLTYIFKNVKFKADWMPGQGFLSFSLDSTPAILSLPTAIWALEGFPDYPSELAGK